jgi:predicted TPR repeat methyltransferase
MEPSESTTRELTLEEAVSLAILMQKGGQLAEAGEVYRRVLETAPDHPRALHFAGVLAHQQGRNDEALALIERSLALALDQADWFSNLGIVLQSDGRLDRAIDAYQRAIAIDPGHANAHSNLGVLLRATGRQVEAEAAYRTAIQLDPAHVDAYTNLGILLDGLKRTEEAAACYCKVITLRPRHRDARKLLALAHSTLGEIDEAVKIFEQWLEEEPGDPIARHMLAACTGRDVPQRASNAFVETTFDSFAASFEAKLARLSYRAPTLIGAMLEDVGLEQSNRLDVLDAGCGTGLCGAIVAPYARRLVGVDLFVSADTLVYFGELKELLAAAAGALRADGLLVFTLEHVLKDDVGYRLAPHGRYGHTQAYVERQLTASGLRAKIVQADLRTEAGAPVPGLVVRAAKTVSVRV